MLTITLFSQKRAEKIIHANKGKHRMHWQKFYDDNGEGLRARYMIFYYPAVLS